MFTFSYISPRIIAMSYPAQGLEAVYRNKLKDVAELLESKHKDKYLIINVSDRSYDTSFFKNQVRLTADLQQTYSRPISVLLVFTWRSIGPYALICVILLGKSYLI